MGRRIGFKSLTCQAGLWDLMRGKYKLGDTVIDGLNVDYMIDDGKGTDTWDRLMTPKNAPPAPASGAPGAPAGSGKLPQLSGKIVINSGTVTLIRGTIQPKLFNTTWEQARLESVEATFDITALDKPWTYEVHADTLEDNAPRGTLTSSGTVSLGDAAAMTVDVRITGENVRTGPLGATLIPGATAADVRQAVGPVLAKVDVAIKSDNGSLTFAKCEASGPVALVRGRPTVDLTTTPATLGVAAGEPSVISLGISKRLAAGIPQPVLPRGGRRAGKRYPDVRIAAGAAGRASVGEGDDGQGPGGREGRDARAKG
jgi:hypothetical protein